MSVNWTPSSSTLTHWFDGQDGGLSGNFTLSWDNNASKRAFMLGSTTVRMSFGSVQTTASQSNNVRELYYIYNNAASSEGGVNGGTAVVVSGSPGATSAGTTFWVGGTPTTNGLSGGYYRGSFHKDGDYKSNRASIETYIL
jgi:hypothetical protein